MTQISPTIIKHQSHAHSVSLSPCLFLLLYPKAFDLSSITLFSFPNYFLTKSHCSAFTTFHPPQCFSSSHFPSHLFLNLLLTTGSCHLLTDILKPHFSLLLLLFQATGLSLPFTIIFFFFVKVYWSDNCL